MDAFLKCFVKQHSGKSLVTREIVDAMHHHFGEDKVLHWKLRMDSAVLCAFTYFCPIPPLQHALLRQIEWERWMFVPGMPPVVNE